MASYRWQSLCTLAWPKGPGFLCWTKKYMPYKKMEKGNPLRKGPFIKIVIGILIIVSWAGMMFLLVEKEGLIKGDFKKTTIREFMPEDIQLDTWKGIYIKDRWVGYLHTILAPWETGYRVNSQSYLRFKMFNQTKTLSMIKMIRT